jgi:MFS family permease
VAAAASAAATGVWQLVGFRVLAAAGAALMTPTSISLLLATFEPDQRGAAVRNWAGIGGFAAALGPLIGGLLVSIGWRWVFAFNALSGVVAMGLALRHLPAVPGHAMRRPSLLAAALVTGGISALIFTIVKVNAWGWRSPEVAASAAVAAVLLGLFAWHCARSANPLVEPALFGIRSFTGAALAMVPYSVTFGAMLFSVAVWGQSAWGWTALQTGLSIIAGPLLVPVTATFATSRLIARVGPAWTIALGIALIVVGFCAWALFMGLAPNVALVVGGMALNGIGVGLIFPTLMGASTQALPPSSFATGSAVINMLRQAAIAIGVAIFVALIGSPASAQARLDAFRLGWWVMAAITALTLVPVFRLLRRPG